MAFVTKEGICTYYQVTANMIAQEAFKRELHPQQNIRDYYEKNVLTAERLTVGNYGGIQVKYLVDWSLEG